MPLDEHLPVLDDHTYDSIITEMRSRIARYTPEWKPVWTDFNDSDPGITMLQVFAWLGEMLAYRMNKVPALLYLKFLQLLGVELRPASRPARRSRSRCGPPRPARGHGPEGYAGHRGNARRRSAAGVRGRPSAGLPEAETVAVLAYDGYAYTDVTAGDAAATGYQPFGPTANAGSALLLGFDAASRSPAPRSPSTSGPNEPRQRGAAVSCGLPPAAGIRVGDAAAGSTGTATTGRRSPS